MQTWKIEGDRRDKVLSALQGSIWFKSLPTPQLESVLDLAALVGYDDGETILAEGDPALSFYLLLKGVVGIEAAATEGTKDLGHVRAPFNFGEIGVLLGRPHTATLVAVDSVLVLRFEAQMLHRLIETSPEFGLNISRSLASRLAQVSQMVELPRDYRGGRPAEEVLGLLPLSFMERYRVLPLRLSENVLTLGFVDPPTPAMMAGLRQYLGHLETESVGIDSRQFNDVLSSLLGSPAWREDKTDAGPTSPESANPKLDVLLERVVAEGASDLHLAAGRKPRWRVDGDLISVEDTAALGPNEVYDLFEGVLDPRLQEEFQSRREIDFAYALKGEHRFRINLFRSLRGVDAAVRHISERVLGFDQLGLPGVLRTFCDQPTGLVLVTGPTGSGKSTTVAAMVDHINRNRKCHILTLEDPIEYVYEDRKALVHQREIGSHTDGFASALRAGLREDPDVVVVGEVRDAETMSLVLEVASSGHLVFATLHTASVVLTLQLVIEMFPGSEQSQARATLADALRGVLCQTLLKKRGGGRIPAFELMRVNNATSHLIREGKMAQIPNSMRGDGSTLLNTELARLVEERKVDFREALLKAVDKKDLAKRLGREI